jgi:hypothetical protein
MPTVYDGLFPDGTFLTKATRPQPPRNETDQSPDENGKR